MPTTPDHNKLLTKLAKKLLAPHGITQKGRSRTFLYDKGWFTVLIEFQPSSWSKGTYLNIGVDLHFYPRDYFTFSYGHREREFEAFQDEAQFTQLVNALCDQVIVKLREIDQNFRDIPSALETVKPQTRENAWKIYDLGILYALASDPEKAQKELQKVIATACEYEWETERNYIAEEVLKRVQEGNAVSDHIKELVHKTRQLKKLPEVSLDALSKNYPS